VSNFFILNTVLTVPLVALVLFARDEIAARLTISLTQTYDFLWFLQGFFVIIKERLILKKSVTDLTRYSNPSSYTWWTRHAVATCLATDACRVTTATLIADLTDLLLGHGTCQVCDYVVVPIDVITHQIQAFRGLDLTLKNYAATI
jgi:hypothetical protein